jgi:hypothetical protein
MPCLLRLFQISPKQGTQNCVEQETCPESKTALLLKIESQNLQAKMNIKNYLIKTLHIIKKKKKKARPEKPGAPDSW